MIDPAREVSPADVAEQARGGDQFLLLDVRNPWEYEICHIDGSMLVPLGQLPGRVAELARGRRIIVYCHHGQRSLMAAEFLRQEGYDAVSMAGGIESWAQEVEPDMARY